MTTMDVYEAIEKRQTIRDFDDKEIVMDVLKRVLTAGLKAPSNDHLRRWEFILIQDRTKRMALLEHINAPKTRQGATDLIDGWGLTESAQREMYIDAIPKQQSMLLHAGALIMPCFYVTGPLLKPKTLSSLNSFASIWCCIENMLIAAASEGIYGVTRILFENERMMLKEHLNIPDEYQVPCYLALGYPKAIAKRTRQHEVRLGDIIHLTKW
jgi:nitroreductase